MDNITKGFLEQGEEDNVLDSLNGDEMALSEHIETI
jgi:hypothetical protein